jgi:protein-disulfide isomerase
MFSDRCPERETIMTLRPLLLTLAAVLAMGGLAPAAQAQQSMAPQVAGTLPAAGSFTPAQRAEIVDILRQAMIRDPSILRQAIAALQTEDQKAQANAQGQAIAAAHDQLLADASDPSIGNPHGDVSVVEFYDVRCPYCRQARPLMEALTRQDPKVRVIFKDIPILGPASVVGARALLAAERQGGYAKMQEALMSESAPATEASIRADATRLGMNPDRLVRDMSSPAVTQKLSENAALAQSLGISGTPAFVIGNTLVPGAIGVDEMHKLVDATRAG